MQINDIVIRKAALTDLPVILTLYQQPEMDGNDGVDLATAEKLFARINRYPCYHFYIAFVTTEQPEKAVGTFSLLVMDNLGHQGTPSGIVEAVCVAEDYQGLGIGETMMKHAMQICREQGCYKMVLSSNKRRTRAHDFYRSLGFEQHGISFSIDLKSKDVRSTRA